MAKKELNCISEEKESALRVLDRAINLTIQDDGNFLSFWLAHISLNIEEISAADGFRGMLSIAREKLERLQEKQDRAISESLAMIDEEMGGND